MGEDEKFEQEADSAEEKFQDAVGVAPPAETGAESGGMPSQEDEAAAQAGVEAGQQAAASGAEPGSEQPTGKDMEID
jgi:hypothetical protein